MASPSLFLFKIWKPDYLNFFLFSILLPDCEIVDAFRISFVRLFSSAQFHSVTHPDKYLCEYSRYGVFFTELYEVCD